MCGYSEELGLPDHPVVAGARRPVVVPHELGALVPDPHVAHDLQLHARDLNLSSMGGHSVDVVDVTAFNDSMCCDIF